MIGRFWRNAPWWMAFGAAALALFDLQFGVVGRVLMLGAIAIGLVGMLVAPVADALLLAIAVSLFPGDVWLLGVAPALLYRAARCRSVGFDGSFRSMFLFGFFISAAASGLFGLIAVEARPLQWFVWMATLGIPLFVLGAAFPVLPKQIAPVLSRFLLFVLWLQVPVCVVQLVRHGEPEPGDWFAGVWADANLVGLWGAVAMSVCAVRVVTGTVALKGTRARMIGCGHFVAAAFLVWGASAKIYSASIFGAAGVVTVMLLIAGTGLARIGTVVRAGVVAVAILLMGMLAESWVRDNFDAFIWNWENSEKQILLARIAFDVGQRYNSILGVGPGMLASRAASAASGDILYKETERAFASVLAPAPKPERWAMYGLWDAEVAQGVLFKSALLTAPFSGWGSMRGELGWPAVILLSCYLLSLGFQMASIATRDPGARSIGIAAAIGCVALLPMLIFDNILEQPHIMGSLTILVIAARGFASGLQRSVTSVLPAAFQTPVAHAHPQSSLPQGPL